MHCRTRRSTSGIAYSDLVSTLEETPLYVDEDGFVALVAPDRYAGFVGANWTFEQVTERFVAEMNRRSLFIACPGSDHASADMTFSWAPTTENVQREVSGIIEVGADGLWITDYTQLTMAAQFASEGPTASFSSTRVPVDEGRYRVTLQQVSDERGFLLVVTPADADTSADDEHTSVPWLS
jgi:hypothetical protein